MTAQEIQILNERMIKISKYMNEKGYTPEQQKAFIEGMVYQQEEE